MAVYILYHHLFLNTQGRTERSEKYETTMYVNMLYYTIAITEDWEVRYQALAITDKIKEVIVYPVFLLKQMARVFCIFY